MEYLLWVLLPAYIGFGSLLFYMAISMLTYKGKITLFDRMFWVVSELLLSCICWWEVVDIMDILL